jgi:hypothetical protein
MGGGYSKEQGGPGEGIVVDTPMAAAASTLLYQLQYDGDDSPDPSEASNGKKASHHLITLDLCASSSSDDNMDYKPDGLVFSDDRHRCRKSKPGGQSSTVESATSLITTWLTVFRTL